MSLKPQESKVLRNAVILTALVFVAIMGVVLTIWAFGWWGVAIVVALAISLLVGGSYFLDTVTRTP